MLTDVLLIKVTRRFVGGAGTGRAAWERMLAISYIRYFCFMSLTNKFCTIHKHLSTRTIIHEREKAVVFAAVKFVMVSKRQLFVKEWNRKCCRHVCCGNKEPVECKVMQQQPHTTSRWKNYTSPLELNEEVRSVSEGIICIASSSTLHLKPRKPKKHFIHNPQLPHLSTKCKAAWRKWCDMLLIDGNITRPIDRIFRRGVTWVSDVYVCMHKHARLEGSRGMLPQENF